jgi:AcrR family transcriptional regulator
MPAQAKTKKKTSPGRQELAELAMDIAGDFGWAHMRLQDLAEEAGVPLAEIAQHFEDKTAILYAYGRHVDYKTLGRAEEPDLTIPVRDRLFDVLMTRFDILNEKRDGVISVLKSFRQDPAQAAISLPHLGRSMAWMLEAAGVDPSGMRGALRIMGLKLIYLRALRTWMEDDTADMAKTMAVVDKSLQRADQIAGQFNL